MNIQNFIDDYITWLRNEITFSQVGEYYEINTPFLDPDNDYTQFYVKMENGTVYFTDDGYTINRLEMNGFKLTPNRKKQLNQIINRYCVRLDGQELTLSAPASEVAQKKHAFIQCILHVTDLYLTVRTKTSSFFLDDIQDFFVTNDIFCMDNVQFTGKSGFIHSYDFAMQRTKNKPERLCLAINTPTKSSMSNALFAWNDTLPSRKSDSRLIVILNDMNSISKGIEEGFANYNVSTIRWSERNQDKNIELLTV